jgi:hypothetical protein
LLRILHTIKKNKEEEFELKEAIEEIKKINKEFIEEIKNISPEK